MKYRLKNQKLQEQLDEISDGNFSDALKGVKIFPNPVVFRLGEDGYATQINLLPKDVEQVLEYDEDDWNEWPDITPPPFIPMRLELFEKNPTDDLQIHRCFFKGAAMWNGTSWGPWTGPALVGPKLDPEEFKEKQKIAMGRYRPWG